MSKANNNWSAQQFQNAAFSGGELLKQKSRVRIAFPEGTKEVKLLSIAEITAPGGLTIEFRLPFPMTRHVLTKLADSIKTTGGSVEIQE